MKKLSEKKYWDDIYVAQQNTETKHSVKTKPQVSKSYSDYVLWEFLFKKYLQSLTPSSKVLEVGSAPGDFLIKFHNVYEADVYGVEYAPAGALVNKTNFENAGINPEHVINEDFFSTAFQSRYREVFDVVISRGFIEHFDDVKHVVDCHLRLLRPNGILIITIPNLSGLNYGLLSLMHKEVIGIHNLKIMKKKVFQQLFDPRKIAPLYNGFFGTFDFAMLNANPNAFSQFIYKAGMRVQTLLNGIFRHTFGKRMVNSQFTSPYLIFIGQKK